MNSIARLLALALLLVSVSIHAEVKRPVMPVHTKESDVVYGRNL